MSSCTVNSALNCFPPPFCRILTMTTNLWKQNILQDKFLKGTQRDETLKTRHLPFWICVISDYKFRFAIFFSLKCKSSIALLAFFDANLISGAFLWESQSGAHQIMYSRSVSPNCLTIVIGFWKMIMGRCIVHQLCVSVTSFRRMLKEIFVFWDISKYVLITHLPCYNSADWFVCLF